MLHFEANFPRCFFYDHWFDTRDEWVQFVEAASTVEDLSAALLSLEDALNLEYLLTTRLFLSGELPEGVRALLVDKDKAPRWNPATLSDVSEDVLTDFLGPLTDTDELGLTAGLTAS